jgi:dipeptidyl aminopeptidase/acylaminoacyl peptidase
VFDQTLQWATEDTPGHVINYMQGLPWEVPDAHLAASPLFSADSISTPTVIHVGEHDPRVPVEHARALYRALHVYLDVPVELLVYPGQGHSLSTPTFRAAKMAWDRAWFDNYVLGIEPGAEEPEVEEAP